MKLVLSKKKVTITQIVAECDKCGGKLMIRDDDHLEAINKRIEKFHEETKQVIDYFKEKGHIVYIHADKTPDAIFEEIEQKIF